MKIGDEVIDAKGDLWTVLNAPCQIRGAESEGFFRRETPPEKRGGQQYGEHIPGPLVVWSAARRLECVVNGCQTCGGFGNRHDPVAHGLYEGEPFTAEELCQCGHEHHRHDMGNGCIECRCRRFQDAS